MVAVLLVALASWPVGKAVGTTVKWPVRRSALEAVCPLGGIRFGGGAEFAAGQPAFVLAGTELFVLDRLSAAAQV